MLTFNSQEKKTVEDECLIFAESLCSNVQAARGESIPESIRVAEVGKGLWRSPGPFPFRCET